MKSEIDRFLDKTIMIPFHSCWEWNGAMKNKYGVFWFKNKNQYAHRVSFKIFKGIVQNKKIVMHSCDNPRCVNPDHLISGTQSQNIKDMDYKNRRTAAKLTTIEVLEIRNKFKNGKSMRDISTEYLIDYSQINRIINLKSWRFI